MRDLVSLQKYVKTTSNLSIRVRKSADMVGAETVEPMNLFQVWLEEAHETEVNDPTAMTLATVSAAGAPSARMVLLKEADDRGFVFYTNTESQKRRGARCV